MNVLGIVAAILGSLGGGVLIVGAFAKWLGDLWAKRLIQDEKNKLDQELENYKVRLKKSEFLFQKEFEAASEYVALIRRLMPPFRHPNMDWYDACDDIALEFDKIESTLESYFSKHGAILDEQAKNKISECIGICAEGKFDVGEPHEVPRESNEAADRLYKLLIESEQLMLGKVHEQAAT